MDAYKIERLSINSPSSSYHFQSDDDTPGDQWVFQTPEEVGTFFWGRDVELYCISKNGREPGTPPTANITALIIWLIQQ